MNRIFFALLGVAFIVYIYAKVRSSLFPEGKSLFWLAGGFAILLLSIFPKVIDRVSAFLGIAHAPSLLFLLTSLFLIFRVFRLEQDIALLGERLKELAQINALQEEKLRQKQST